MSVEEGWEKFRQMYPEAASSPWVEATFYTSWRLSQESE